MYAVALTGGIGSGKSTVSDLFSGLGIEVIDADALSHALTAPGGAALPEIAAAFGAELIQPDGALDRPALRARVFADDAARRRLEGILHPRIRADMQARMARATSPYVILAIPLLFETGQATLADRVLVVDIPEDEQIARVQARSGLRPDEIRRIISAQVPRARRLAGADDVIDNSGEANALPAMVQALHARYLALAAAKARPAD